MLIYTGLIGQTFQNVLDVVLWHKAKIGYHCVSMLKVVCAIISDDEGKYLLVERSEGMNHPLKWEFPGGKLEANESPGEAIKRELKEELNVQINPKQILATVVWEYPNKKVGLIPIICELRSKVIHLREHRGHGWFVIDEMRERDLLEADKTILNQLQ